MPIFQGALSYLGPVRVPIRPLGQSLAPSILPALGLALADPGEGRAAVSSQVLVHLPSLAEVRGALDQQACRHGPLQGHTGWGGGEGGLSDPAWGTRSQKDALKCWRPLRTPVRREKEGCTEQVGSGALRSDPAGKPRAPAGFPCFCKLTESRSNFQKARSLLSPPPRQSGQKILPRGFLQPNTDSVLSSFFSHIHGQSSGP